MKIGMVGLGALGMPVAVAMAECGHEVVGCDLNPERMQKDFWPFKEEGAPGEPEFQKTLAQSSLRFDTLEKLVEHAEIIFFCVQTPHARQYEGVTRLPRERSDFDYSYLATSIEQVVLIGLHPGQIIAVISTVMPGTLKRCIRPLIPEAYALVYTPFFEAMGTVIRDFLTREFVLIGTDRPEVADTLKIFFSTITKSPQIVTTIESAEAIKVFYNTFTSMKIVFTNTVMEACHKIQGCDVDEVMTALQCANDRLISPRYLNGGMGDGGVCHPRDNIALSWFAREHCLSFDFFNSLMAAREAQADWLVTLMEDYELPKFILGTAFKSGSNIQTGSSAVLCKNILIAKGVNVETFDPFVDPERFRPTTPYVFLIGCNHPEFKNYQFPRGSVVIDPWRMIPPKKGVTVIGVGRN